MNKNISCVNLNFSTRSLESMEKSSSTEFSISSTESNSDNSLRSRESIQNRRNHGVELITIFYFVILVIYGVMIELSGWMADTDDKKMMAKIHDNSLKFNLYLFIVSFIFFGYSYLMFFVKLRKKKQIQRLWHKIQQRYLTEKVWGKQEMEGQHSGILPGVGSLYLRIGALFFAIVACVYYAFAAHWKIFEELDICAFIFTVIQTHFMFFSSSMFDSKFPKISQFGLMHLVATNLIIWFQFLFVKNQSTEKYIKKYWSSDYASSTAPTVHELMYNSDEDDENDYVIGDSRSRVPYDSECRGVECVFGSYTKVFYTAVVEYSLIAAVVMFIVWHNLGKKNFQQHHHSSSSHDSNNVHGNGKKKVFVGLIGSTPFIAGSAAASILFYIFSDKSEYYKASQAFYITEIIQNCIGILACLYLFWRLWSFECLEQSASHNPHHANQELLDMILLGFGLIGELAYSTSGLTVLCLTAKSGTLSAILTTSHILRIVESVLQCFLICFASRLKPTEDQRNSHPGKSIFTFLTITNITMFIMSTFISDKVGTYKNVMQFYGGINWVFLVRFFNPLTVFFRFHCSVCFDEIRQHLYL